MKKTFLIILTIVVNSLTLYSQEKKDNYSFFKLYVTNEKNEVLLIKFGDAWEIPGSSYKGNFTISQLLDTIADKHGITIKDKKMACQLTFHHEIRPNPTIMLYYTAKYVSGELKTPSWGQDVKWFSIEEAYKVIPYPEMKKIIEKINEDSSAVWGGAIKILYDIETKKSIGFEMLEEFYKW